MTNLKKKTKNKAFKIILIVILSILIILGVLYLVASYYFNSLIENVEVERIEESELNITVIEPKEESHEVINFMLVGADNSDSGIHSYSQARSDVFKVVSLDYTDKKIKITSLDRDVVVWMPSEDCFGHFNWAYWYGGAKGSISAINYNLDLDVSKYVGISFAGFIDVIDYIGGVDINLTNAEAYELNNGGATKYVTAGLNHLDGYTALSYSRIRHIDSDFVRMDRQNDVIKAVITKMKDLSATELYSVVGECLKYVTTNLTYDEIKSYLIGVLQFDLNNIDTLTYPSGRYDDICGSSIGGYLLRSYSDAVIEIHQFIYNDDSYVPSKTVYDNEKKTYDTFGEFRE